MEIPEILRRLRLEHNYTQEYMGELLGVDYSTYGKYEKGSSKLRLDQAKIIADAFRMTIDDLFNYGEKNIPSVAEPQSSYHRNKNILLTVELDGTEETVNRWLQLLPELNKALRLKMG